MAVIENSVEIRRRPEEVFDALVDLRNELKWNPDAELMEKLTDGPVRLGTQYRAKWKQSRPLLVECVRYDRPHTWAYHNAGPVEVEFSATISPHADGCVIAGRFQARPHGWFRLVFPIFILVMKRAERANFRYIKEFLEPRPPE